MPGGPPPEGPIALLTLSPFVAALVALVLVARWPGSARWLAAWPAVLTGVFALEMTRVLDAGPRTVETAWAPSLGLTLSLQLDALGLLFALLITGIGTLVVLYASAYLEDHPHLARFYASLFVFMGAMVGVALSDNVLALFVFWELTGFSSFLLIGFDHERAESRAAALQALIVTGAGGLALLAAGIMLHGVTGTYSLAAMTAHAQEVAGHPFATAIVVLVLLAAFTKSAQVPFHFWLPNAMAAPTPVSAYLHSATMVKAGLYLMARVTPLLGATAYWKTAVVAAGAATMALGAYRAVQEVDLKRILAYSTISGLGVITLLIGIGTADTLAAALVYLVAHACYKGALFLVAGSVDHGTGTRDVSVLGGLRRVMPFTAATGGLAALSMAGVPLTLGFVGKDAAYEALLHGDGTTWALALMIGVSILLGLAGLLAGVAPFIGAARDGVSAHEAPWRMWAPPLLLAVAGVALGVAPALVAGPLAAAAAAAFGAPVDQPLAAWHGLTTAALLSLMTLAGVGVAYAGRAPIRRYSWLPSIGTEALYTSGMRLLDAAGQAIAPALHSASLRAYVMAIVLTTAVSAGAVLLTTAGIPAVPAGEPARVHEVIVVLVVVLGAIAAALAQTTMQAVLSLGAVGYGVATTFLMFGAPDLAMTQFSVETLTALIYVLVFRHFPNLDTLSPRSTRLRDAALAGGLGLVVTTLVLTAAKTASSPALREYFSTFAPTLGHGRNVVNVILVDFRAFDTLGEIAVLATAAIGVRALLALAAADRPRSAAAATAPSTSMILRTATRMLMPLLLLFAVFLLLRGHNKPGGGFVGGLVAAAAYALYAMAYGVQRARQALIVEPLTLLGGGLLIALASGLPGLFLGRPFLSALWMTDPIHVGTPALFDLGVFLVVTGVVLMMVFSLAEEA